MDNINWNIIRDIISQKKLYSKYSRLRKVLSTVDTVRNCEYIKEK